MTTRTNRSLLSIVVPTYREAENLPSLIARLAEVARQEHLTIELLVMDDDSRDGTEELIRALNLPWVHLIVRRTARDLSPAVVDGLRSAHGYTMVVMDADHSHPPERIPAMLAALDSGADFVIGSRYVPGGSTDEHWSWLRRMNSRVATLLARPFTAAKDPMSGFFALRSDTFARADHLSPVGYKIGLELIVKCHCQRVAEVPIHFAKRRAGVSKLTMRERWRYIKHLRRLWEYRVASAFFPGWRCRRHGAQLPD